MAVGPYLGARICDRVTRVAGPVAQPAIGRIRRVAGRGFSWSRSN